MKGFDRRKNGPLYAAISHLKDFVVREGVARLTGSGFGTTVGSPAPLAGPTELLALSASEKNTCLALPLEVHAQTASVDSTLLIIVTDGVASAERGACGKSCAEGSDVACVASALANLAHEGLGLWVVGLRLPFQGRYFPEQGGAAFEVPQGSSRPLYLWIVSPDWRLGHGVTRAMATWARSSLPADRILAVEVWPGRWRGYRVADQPPQRWSSSAFSAYDYAEAQHLQPGVAIASVHRQSCLTNTPGSVLAPPRLCLQRTGNGSRWIGQIPVVATDGDDAELSELSSLVAVRSPIPPRRAAISTDPAKPTPTPTASRFCLTVGGVPVSGDQVQGLDARWVRGCLEPASQEGKWDRLLTAIDLNGAAETAAIDLEWTVTPDLGALSSWDTDDDSSLAAVGRTFNLRRLWGLVTDILSRQHKRLRLIEFGWAGASGG
jgi:hypothetical protein